MFRTGSQFSLGHLIWRQKKCSSLLKYSFIIKCMEVNNSLLRWAPGIFYISLYTFNSFSSFLLILHSHHFPDSAHLELKALPVAPTETRVVPELKCGFVEDWIPPLPSELWSLPSEWQQPTQEDKNAFLSVLFIFQISFVSTILWESLLQLCTPFVRQESIKFK